MNFMMLVPILMLTCSNIFMTFAWYWHLKYHDTPIVKVILISWCIALFEYCLAVPANRLGSQYFTPAQLKTIQEVVTLTVFTGFAIFYLGEKITLYHVAGFALILIGASVIFLAPKT